MARKITHIVIHCSASDRHKTTPEAIKRWHTDPKPRGNGWSDIGYHRVITGDGKVHQGRPDHIQGAHEPYYNRDSLGICLTGNFDKDAISEDDPQFRALVQTCAVLAKRHGVPAKNIVGHRDAWVSRGLRPQKTCPGANLYALLPRLRELVGGYLA